MRGPPSRLWHPQGPDGSGTLTCGAGGDRRTRAAAWAGGRYAFIEFETAAQAKQAVKAGDGFRLDKTHVFACNLFPEIERLTSLSEQFTPPNPEPYQERVWGTRTVRRVCPARVR